MTVIWECGCGWHGDDGHSAFLHRKHCDLVNPNPTPMVQVVRRLNGIEKETIVDISKLRLVP